MSIIKSRTFVNCRSSCFLLRHTHTHTHARTHAHKKGRTVSKNYTTKLLDIKKPHLCPAWPAILSEWGRETGPAPRWWVAGRPYRQASPGLRTAPCTPPGSDCSHRSWCSRTLPAKHWFIYDYLLSVCVSLWVYRPLTPKRTRRRGPKSREVGDLKGPIPKATAEWYRHQGGQLLGSFHVS